MMMVGLMLVAPRGAVAEGLGRAWPVTVVQLEQNIDIFLPKPTAESDFQKLNSMLFPDGEKNKKFTKKIPFVILLENSGASDKTTGEDGKYDDSEDVFYPWTRWFLNNGVAVVQVHSAMARGLENWEKSGQAGCDGYRQDPAMVYDIVTKKIEKLDPDKFALMGFSMGGRQALNSYPFFKDKKPTAIFSFYNACVNFEPKKDLKVKEWCPINYPLRSPTEIHILYGDEDDFGKVVNSRGETTFSICKKKADEDKQDNLYFHVLPGALHVFEDRYSQDDFTDPFRYGRNAASPAAIKQSVHIMSRVLSKSWGIKLRQSNIETEGGPPAD